MTMIARVMDSAQAAGAVRIDNVAENGAKGRPMHSQPIFIIGQARSGTTLLQRTLNSVGDILISGEHAGILAGISQSFRTLVPSDGWPGFDINDGDETPYHAHVETLLRSAREFAPCVNGLHLEYLRCLFTTIVYLIANPAKRQLRWGFKEIRYGWGNDFVIPMILDLFPQAQFVFVMRNPIAQIWSKQSRRWWTETFEQNIQIWIEQTRTFQLFASKFQERARLIRYEDVINPCSVAIQSLFDWLHVPYTRAQELVAFDPEKLGATPDRGEPPEDFKRVIRAKCLLEEFASHYVP
jgi:hypothetical protein